MKMIMNVVFGLSLALVDICLISKAECEENKAVIALWHFDEGEGDIAKDSSGNNNDLQLKSVTWTEGEKGKCLSFSAKKTEKGYYPCAVAQSVSDPVVFLADQFTISTWIKPDYESPKTYEILNCGSGDRGPGYRLVLSYGKFSFISGDGKNCWSIATLGMQNGAIPDETLAKQKWSKGKIENRWYHIAVTYKDSIYRIYVDGQLASRKQERAINPNSKRKYFTLGGYQGGFAYPFKGLIDEVEILSRAKTNEEILAELGKATEGAIIKDKEITYEELLSRYAHLMAKGKGERVEYKNERLYVDGKPFLFIGPWGYVKSKNEFELCKKYHLTGILGQARDLDMARDYGLMVAVSALESPKLEGKALEEHIEKLSKHPANLTYFLSDDFLGHLSMIKNIELIRRFDTYRPTLADIVGYDADRKKSSTFIDLLAPYTYPAPAHTYKWYADYLDHNREIVNRKFNWTCPQAGTYSAFARTGQPVYYFTKYPGAAQMRLQTYIGLAHGIRGFMYWPGNEIWKTKRKIAELGILCCEMEYAGDIIVEGEMRENTAVSCRDDITVTRIDKGNDILLIANQYKDGYETWVPEWDTEAVALRIKNTPLDNRRAYLISLPLLNELTVKQDAKDLVITAEKLFGCDLILLTSDEAKIEAIRKKQAVLLPEVSDFALESAKGTEIDVGNVLAQCINRPLDWNSAVNAFNCGQKELQKAQEEFKKEKYPGAFFSARKASSLFRKAGQVIVDKAKSISDYAPFYVRRGLLINFYALPQYFTAFDFPHEKTGKYSLNRPWCITSGDSIIPAKIADLYPDKTAVSSKKGEVVTALHTEPGKTYLLNVISGHLILYDGEDKLKSGQSDCVPLPNNNINFECYLFSPEKEEKWYAELAADRKWYGSVKAGLISAIPIESGKKQKGKVLSAEQPTELFTFPCKKNTSYRFTLEQDKGISLDLQVAVAANPSYILAQTTERKQGSTQVITATAHHDGNLSVVIQRYLGEGSFNLMVETLPTSVPLQKITSAFKETKFAFYGKNGADSIECFKSKGIDGEDLTGNLSKADLGNIDVIILLTNAVKYDAENDDELKKNGSKFHKYVQDGGRLLVFQQNGKKTWHDEWLVYPLKLTNARTDTEPHLQKDTGILNGLEGNDFVSKNKVIGLYPIDAASSDKHWSYSAWTDADRKLSLLSECEYGKGKVVFTQFAIFDRSSEPVMQELLDRLLRHIIKK